MKKGVQLNYEELRIIVKRMRDQGEDVAALHRKTREKVHDLYLEWIGEGADKFFDEMETKLLPALERLAQGLFASQMALTRIMKTIKDADQHTVHFFKRDLAKFGIAGQGVVGTDVSDLLSRNRPHVTVRGGIGGQSSNSVNQSGGVANEGVVKDQIPPNQGGGPSGGDNLNAGDGSAGAGQSGGSSGADGAASTSQGQGSVSAGSNAGSTEGVRFGSGGTGTGSGSTGNQAGPSAMPDHNYQNPGNSSPGTGIGGSPQSGAGSEGQSQNVGVGAAAAGVAGAAGAAGAAAGAVKAVRGRRK